MGLTTWLMYLDCLGDSESQYRRHSWFFTAEYIERVLQSVFHTITIIAVYEIVKETFRRIEVIRLRLKVRKHEMMINNCCVRMHGCQTCYNRIRPSKIAYRSVPPSVFRSLENKIVLWKPQKAPDCYSNVYLQRNSVDEIQSLNCYLSDLTMYMRELCAEQDYDIRESMRKFEMARRRREEEMLLAALRSNRTCPCVAVRAPCNACNTRPNNFRCQ